MKTLVIASLVLLLAAPALAGQQAVSASTLKGMGLEKMQQLSDSDGLAVRGKGPFDNLYFWNRTAFGSGPAPSGNAGFQGPSLSNSFGDRFMWQGFGDNPPGGTTPPTTPPGPTMPGGTGGFGGLPFDFPGF